LELQSKIEILAKSLVNGGEIRMEDCLPSARLVNWAVSVSAMVRGYA